MWARATDRAAPGPRSALPAGGASRPLTICTWSRRRDSNPEPAVYKTAALPIELRRRGAGSDRRWTPWRREMIRSDRRTGQARLIGARAAPASRQVGSGPPGSKSFVSDGPGEDSELAGLARAVVRDGRVAAFLAEVVEPPLLAALLAALPAAFGSVADGTTDFAVLAVLTAFATEA